LECITKSLFVRVQSQEEYMVLVCSVNKKVDLRRVARELGTGRLELARERELAMLGYSPGGVSPIAVGDFPVVMDAELMEMATVLTGAGEVLVEIEGDPRRLREVIGARALSLGADVGTAAAKD